MKKFEIKQLMFCCTLLYGLCTHLVNGRVFDAQTNLQLTAQFTHWHYTLQTLQIAILMDSFLLIMIENR